ncbi:MAG: ribosome-associated translation inhibitor RaiA [Faecalicoccus sp.]|nr:ribosome-associated translation inhibitor RaiA [Faecalicoccus sp.]
MKVKVVGKNITVTQDITERLNKKLSVLTKYFIIDENSVANVLITRYPHKEKVEVTIPTKFALLRAEVTDEKVEDAIDRVVDKLEDQIRRQKTRLSRHSKESLADAFIQMEIDDDADEVVKTKSIVPEVLSLEDAIMNMELIGHDFYIYTDDETDKIAVVYRRRDGGYGLIETE